MKYYDVFKEQINSIDCDSSYNELKEKIIKAEEVRSLSLEIITELLYILLAKQKLSEDEYTELIDLVGTLTLLCYEHQDPENLDFAIDTLNELKQAVNIYGNN